jgi:hypothetical protein
MRSLEQNSCFAFITICCTPLVLLPPSTSAKPCSVHQPTTVNVDVTMGKPKQKINEEVTLNKYVAKTVRIPKSSVVDGFVCSARTIPSSLLAFGRIACDFQQEGSEEGYQIGGSDTVPRRKRQQGRDRKDQGADRKHLGESERSRHGVKSRMKLLSSILRKYYRVKMCSFCSRGDQ